MKPKQVIGIMGEVGVHLEDEAVAALKSPFEPEDVGGAKSQLSFSLSNVETPFELVLQALHNTGSAIR